MTDKKKKPLSQARNDYLEEALETTRFDLQETQQDLQDAKEGIRNLRFTVALLIVGWGLSVGVLLAVLSR